MCISYRLIVTLQQNMNPAAHVTAGEYFPISIDTIYYRVVNLYDVMVLG